MNVVIQVIFAILTIGVAFYAGFMVAKRIYNVESIGDLRIDESDPDDGPYLFLELKTRPNTFKHVKRVTLNVKAENYISQK